MSFTKKIQKMQQEGIISAEVAQKMIENEAKKSQDMLWKNLFRIAGVLIGIGILMIIGAHLESWFEIFYGLSYIALIAASFGLYKSVIQSHNGLRELFAVLSFILVGAILGLIRQKYQLDFAQMTVMLWCFIGLPYVLLSRSYVFNIIWWLMLNFGLPWEYLYDTALFQKITKGIEIIVEKWQAPVILSIISAFISALFCYIGVKIYHAVKQKAILPNAFALWMCFSMYMTLIACGVLFSFRVLSITLSDTAFLYNKIFAQILVIGFLLYRAWWGYRHSNNSAIKRNAVLLEIYIIYLFLAQLHGLFTTGIGLILTGCILLASIFAMRQIHHRFLQPLTSAKGKTNE